MRVTTYGGAEIPVIFAAGEPPLTSQYVRMGGGGGVVDGRVREGVQLAFLRHYEHNRTDAHLGRPPSLTA